MQYTRHHVIPIMHSWDPTTRQYQSIPTQVAKEVGSDALARPWSRHSAGSSRHDRLVQQQQGRSTGRGALGARTTHSKDGRAADDGASDGAPHGQQHGKHGKKRKTRFEVDEAIANDPKLQEFLSVMQPRSKKQLWSNDDVLPVKMVCRDFLGMRDFGGWRGMRGFVHVGVQQHDQRSMVNAAHDMAHTQPHRLPRYIPDLPLQPTHALLLHTHTLLRMKPSPLMMTLMLMLVVSMVYTVMTMSTIKWVVVHTHTQPNAASMAASSSSSRRRSTWVLVVMIVMI